MSDPLLADRRPQGRLRAPTRASCRPSTASRSRSTAVRSSRSSASPARASRSPGMTLMGLTRGPNARIAGSAKLDGQELLTASNEELRKIRGNDIAMIFQDPISSLNPVYRVGWQIVEQIRTHNPQVSKADAMAQAVDADGARRRPARRRAPALLPARVLGRHAPARDDRDGALLLAEAADRRRADHGARRHDPGADPRRAAPAARRDQRRASSSSPTTSRWSPTSPTASSSCTRAAWSSRARSTSSSTTRSTPTPGACSARSRGSTATAGTRLPAIAGSPPSLLAPAHGLPLQAPLPARLRPVRSGAGAGVADSRGARARRPLLAERRGQA